MLPCRLFHFLIDFCRFSSSFLCVYYAVLKDRFITLTTQPILPCLQVHTSTVLSNPPACRIVSVSHALHPQHMHHIDTYGNHAYGGSLFPLRTDYTKFCSQRSYSCQYRLFAIIPEYTLRNKPQYSREPFQRLPADSLMIAIAKSLPPLSSILPIDKYAQRSTILLQIKVW